MESKELFIMMSDGDKKAEFQISNYNNEYQLAVIDGLFKFFDIKVDFKEMVDTYNKAGKAYKDFYDDKKEVVLTETNEKVEVTEPKPTMKDPMFKERYESALTEEIVKTRYENNTKIIGDLILYQCHYICPSCKKRANRYVKKYDRTIKCHECNKEMQVKSATETLLEQDIHGNYFIAGDFIRAIKKFGEE